MKRTCGHCYLALCLLALACSKKEIDVTKQAPEYYLFSAYDAASGEWTIVHVDRVKQTKVEIHAVCDYYHWANHEMVTGPKSCDMRVGQQFEPNPLRNRPGEFAAVWKSGDTLQFQSGSGAQLVTQGFRIVSAHVVQ